MTFMENRQIFLNSSGELQKILLQADVELLPEA